MGDSGALRAAMTQIMDDPAAFRDRARPVRPIPTFADQAAELATIYASVV
jgi:hypothetical protein